MVNLRSRSTAGEFTRCREGAFRAEPYGCSVPLRPGKHWPKRRLERHKWSTGVGERVVRWRARGTMVNVQFTRANVNGQLRRSFDAETSGNRTLVFPSWRPSCLWKTSGTVIFYKRPTAPALPTSHCPESPRISSLNYLETWYETWSNYPLLHPLAFSLATTCSCKYICSSKFKKYTLELCVYVEFQSECNEISRF